MPYSSGTYTLPALNPVVTGTTISSTWANNTMNDIVTALSTCVLKDGTQTTTASVPFAVGISVTTGITTPSTTFALANTTATTINAFGAATAVNMGAGAASTLTASFTTAIALNTAAITSNQTTVAVINTNATTVNAFGAASSALNIGHASAAAAFAGGISIPTGKSVTGAGTATVTGFATVSATTLTGTLSTAAQPNVTSLGTLVTNTTVTGVLKVLSPAGVSQSGYLWTAGTTAGSSVVKGYFGVNVTTSDGTVEILENSGNGLRITQTTGAAVFSGTLSTGSNSITGGSYTSADPGGGAGVWKFGIANAVSPTSPNRTLTVDIGGTLYYIHAKTTNN